MVKTLQCISYPAASTRHAWRMDCWLESCVTLAFTGMSEVGEHLVQLMFTITKRAKFKQPSTGNSP